MRGDTLFIAYIISSALALCGISLAWYSYNMEDAGRYGSVIVMMISMIMIIIAIFTALAYFIKV